MCLITLWGKNGNYYDMPFCHKSVAYVVKSQSKEANEKVPHRERKKNAGLEKDRLNGTVLVNFGYQTWVTVPCNREHVLTYRIPQLPTPNQRHSIEEHPKISLSGNYLPEIPINKRDTSTIRKCG